MAVVVRASARYGRGLKPALRTWHPPLVFLDMMVCKFCE
jgi:hypothetical protein